MEMYLQRLILLRICKVYIRAMSFHILSSVLISHVRAENYGELALDSNKQAVVYQVLESINPEIDWKSLYPDNLYTGGPHGIVSDIDKDDKQWHIVEINLGWVSEFSNNPSCSSFL